MHAAELSKTTNGLKEEKDDGPSVLGRFLWTVVGNSCIPCLLKSDGTKYVSVRIAESKVLANFLVRLNAEVFNCVSVKSFGITEAEMKLLNEINSKHCEFSFGREPFSMDTDFIVKFDDLIEFYQFMDTCYNKLINQIPSCSKNKCGFVRINDDSVVPYAVKNSQKYVPLFYFEGETESLRTKAINLENWDLAYLKFCCKVQGIKNELFASEQCLVTSLEDVKSYFPEGTKFDDYWPSKVVEMQTPNRSDVNGNHSWVQTPHIDSSAAASQTSIPNPTHPLASKTAQSALVKQLHNNQRGNPSPVISNVSTPTYAQSNSWSTSMVGNNLNSVQSGSYQIAQPVPQQQQRIAPKQTPVTLHSMNTNSATPRTYSNPTTRPQQQQYYNATANNVPNVSVTQSQPPPPLVKVHPTSVSNVYPNAISASSYNMYSATPVYTLPNTQAHHMNTTSAVQMTTKVRNSVPNQVTSNTRYPPGLTPISSIQGNVLQPNTTAAIGSAMSSTPQLLLGNRSRPSYPASAGDEIIDLSSPPHSPQQVNLGINNMAAVGNTTNGGVTPNNVSSEKIIKIADVVNAANQSLYKIKSVPLYDKMVPTINLDPHNPSKVGLTLYTLHKNYFEKMGPKELKNTLTEIMRCELYRGNLTQQQILRDLYKLPVTDDDLLMIKMDDFARAYKPLLYIHGKQSNQAKSPVGVDLKRQKIS